MTVKAYVNCPALFQEKRLLQMQLPVHNTGIEAYIDPRYQSRRNYTLYVSCFRDMSESRNKFEGKQKDDSMTPMQAVCQSLSTNKTWSTWLADTGSFHHAFQNIFLTILARVCGAILYFIIMAVVTSYTERVLHLSVGGSSRVVLVSPGKVLDSGVVEPDRVEGCHLRPCQAGAACTTTLSPNKAVYRTWCNVGDG
ncbi:MAG: hypothetical protein FRX49_08819 [Trebouxia sp. A1-2]|nr:MAG: hypothetical protein FRX49_08819 [Trebouxia sp. A1-2]